MSRGKCLAAPSTRPSAWCSSSSCKKSTARQQQPTRGTRSKENKNYSKNNNSSNVSSNRPMQLGAPHRRCLTCAQSLAAPPPPPPPHLCNMGVCRAALLALAALLLAGHASALYFHIDEGETKCFIEEVPEETMVVGQYKTQKEMANGKFSPPSSGTGMHVEVHDPNDELIMSKDYQAEGRFAFTTHESGEHTICINSNSTRWFSKDTLRIHLDLRIGEHANDYEMISKKEQLSVVETRLYQLISQVKQISSEQAYQRTRESTFREVSESTNQRVLWWSVAQAAILVVTAWWQVRHLKGFFEAKKLV
eukprot:m.73317 g.73317  ORF g.73317 m.73317 type:complete len:307 (+) comp14335_c0_seq2:742-1662(+)